MQTPTYLFFPTDAAVAPAFELKCQMDALAEIEGTLGMSCTYM